MIELQNASQNNILPAAQLLSREKHNQNSNQNWISDRNLAQDSGSLIVSFFFSFFFLKLQATSTVTVARVESKLFVSKQVSSAVR